MFSLILLTRLTWEVDAVVSRPEEAPPLFVTFQHKGQGSLSSRRDLVHRSLTFRLNVAIKKFRVIKAKPECQGHLTLPNNIMEKLIKVSCSRSAYHITQPPSPALLRGHAAKASSGVLCE